MNHTWINQLVETLNRKENILLTGLSGSARTYLLQILARQLNRKVLCLVPSEEKAYDLAKELRAFLPPERILLFLGRELVFIKENYSRVEEGRILTLRDCLWRPRQLRVIIATPAAFMFPLKSPRQMQEETIHLQVGQDKPLRLLLEQLVQSGYQRADTITRPGEFAVRGGLLDVFPVGDQNPCRIDLFGDTIESLRRFQVETQRSTGAEEHITITPADELFGTDLTATLMDYLPEDSWVFFDEPREFTRQYERVCKRYQAAIREARREEKNVHELDTLTLEKLTEVLRSRTLLYHSYFPGNIPQARVSLMDHVAQQEMEPFFSQLSTLYSRIQEWMKKDYTVYIMARGRAAREQLQKELVEQHITGVQFLDGELDKGFVSSTLQVALVSEQDIWGKKTGHRTARRRRAPEERLLVEDLKLGDYVVHENYGVGIFRGVTRVETDGVTREYILLQYAGTDKLYLPLDKLDALYRYNLVEDREPHLSKLGGSEWERTKRKVSQSIKDMAEELLKLYAARQAREGYAFGPDTPWQAQFEEAFPYQETPDQLKAIRDVKRDMESRRPMDRLICGDVGYGKTEVAMRAAFKAVMDGKQVAMLVPTTVLAEQHYLSFQERFKEFPATIEVLSRFRTPGQQKKVLEDLRKGVVDIIIGTHRLLSKDVSFKDLGLLIIDEEHRFGVAQKEKIKALKELVDVLSLSATPIPRSLHMALTGLRDMSVIETPPPERYPITTYVMEYNEEIIRDAIMNEVERGGQVFFVHNRIEDMERVKRELENLVPEVRIAMGHGRMKEDQLSRVMISFLRGEFDVFLCTTIIESGLDMPNVNTIIIDEADKLGLAQLYQLRGRVGRSSRLAYAYLTYRRDRVLSETAQKRLNAIREFSDLGSGMKIALRDLEIRGAGNILGPEQHGFISAVGFDLYCRMLEEETSRLKGQEVQPQFSPQLDMDVDLYIPDEYIPDSGTKMRVYRRLLLAADMQEVEEIRQELVDRFGPVPEPVQNFLEIATLRIMAKSKDIKMLRRKGREVEIQVAGKLPADLHQRMRGMKFRRINDHTVRLNIERGSLMELHGLLSSI
ncbi:MAG TPA: transcription-repair coupling factor [Syntrophomonadaceae bacterium]|nr:transcription-repair coupling factor [Syntrophomonadaceae bacterium]